MLTELERKLSKQVSDLQIKNAEQETTINSLRATIKALRAENKKLTEKIAVMEVTLEERIAAAVADAVEKSTAPIKEELAKANHEVDRLKAIVNKDSSNSSKPPRTNGFKIIPNSRETSDKAKGGQKGHAGHRLTLPENMEELIAKGVLEKHIYDHTHGSSEYVSRFVIDVEVKIIIAEHRYAKEAELPCEQYNEVSYGDNLKAMSVLLLNEGIVAEKRLSGIISGLTYGTVKLSPATLEHFQAQFAKNLEESGELKAIKQDLLNGTVLHTDDTSMRCAETIEYTKSDDENGEEEIKIKRAEKKSFRATVRTHSNARSTFYTVNPKKDKKGIERDGLLPNYIGTLCHDDEAKFYNYGSKHGTCGEHLSRDLKGLRDLHQISWADTMRNYILSMNNHKKADQEVGIKACDPALLADYENEYDRQIEAGRAAHQLMKKSDQGYSAFNAMLNRLEQRKDCYLLFMRDYSVPFTNNLSERDLRPEKTKEKVSMLFNSWQGIVNHTKIRSFFSTAKKRGQDLFAAVSNVIGGIPVFQ